ncbi:MAG TPA: hypothetical protein VKT29_15940 [Terriglobales bacterium]|nr:hypothetical protein [Terriglobales bacterium]
MTWSSILFGILWILGGIFILAREIPIFRYLQRLPQGQNAKGPKIRSWIFLAMGAVFIAAGVVLIVAYSVRR